MLDNHSKQLMEDFLKDFGSAWCWIEEPAKLIEKYFYIEENGDVSLNLDGDKHLYLGNISDVSFGDVQNVANTIKVLVSNRLRQDEKERLQLT